jgi:hypothetical protein
MGTHQPSTSARVQDAPINDRVFSGDEIVVASGDYKLIERPPGPTPIPVTQG